jgi:predicted DNA-binding transcriptional regulator AlpA
MSNCSTAPSTPPDVPSPDRATLRDRLVSMQDLADELHVCEKTIRRCIQKGQLPPQIQIGGRKYWVASVLDAHLCQKQESAIEVDAMERKDAERRKAKFGIVDGSRN